MSPQKKHISHQPGSGRRERFIQPSILLALLRKPSYGYELIHSIQEFGFVEGQAPPGMIYRHLRQLEDDGMVVSEWETEGTGAAKRTYRLTLEGRDVLEAWIDYMAAQAAGLTNFINLFKKLDKD